METGQLPGEVQTEPGAEDMTVLRGHQTTEASEEAMHLFGRDPEALVDDVDPRSAAADAHVARDVAPVRGKLDGVVEEVAQDRLDPAGVNLDHDRRVRGASEEAMRR